MRIAVLLGIDEKGNHELLTSGDPKKVKQMAKDLTLNNPTKYKVVRFFDQHATDYRVHRNITKDNTQEIKKDLGEAPKGRGRPKKV